MTVVAKIKNKNSHLFQFTSLTYFMAKILLDFKILSNKQNMCMLRIYVLNMAVPNWNSAKIKAGDGHSSVITPTWFFVC